MSSSSLLTGNRLTTHLLASDAEFLKRATEHPFLLKAGRGELSSENLSRWLTQDRYYGLMGYTHLMGGLMSKLPSCACHSDSPRSQQTWRRLRLLSSATANITREMAFFEDVAKRNHLSADQAPMKSTDGDELLGMLAPVTQGYIDYMSNVAAHGTFEEAMVLLWSMEVLYLRAWRFAAKVRSEQNDDQKAVKGDANPNVRAALDELIPNWTSKEFEDFVNQIGELVDEFGRTSNAEQVENYTDVWRRCLWFEDRFWDSGNEGKRPGP